MDNYTANTYDLYKDIQNRTNGELYLGVVGPVRTGKSTFIKRFMDVCVLPNMTKEYEKKQAVDEMPQSSGGKTITTTEPKFIPKEAAEITLDQDVKVSVKLIDCVGFMVEGASGHLENEKERMVKTPWFDYEIPFTQAAELGTRKVINDHASIGIVVTTDGSFTELPRESYLEAEEQTISELKKLSKPFIVLVNSERPYSDEAINAAEEIQEKYSVAAVPMNLEQLKKEDVTKILEKVLYEFPISSIEFFLPKWVEMLPDDHKVKTDIINCLKGKMDQYTYMRDITSNPYTLESDFVERIKVDNIDMSKGLIKIYLDIDESF